MVDNEIFSICRLDQMKDLNTLGPVRRFLVICRFYRHQKERPWEFFKLQFSKSVAKAANFSCASSVSNCQALPAELADNKKLQNLDLGKKFITRRSLLEDIAENPTFDGEHKMVDETLRLKLVDGCIGRAINMG
ncbi:hypothetical protein Pint_06739 [Pistacia integerrima]|uniref:Uncharacterized protein n=1 Tax=Pistacia integerrima TaxID=434235 RepID=A0ACC0XVF8_9ROSI|nr:hypothetical protein Pint_06739 [Pistacia integerrima]